MNGKPRILIFTGDGKGKTTAALGMALRAGGHGLRSCIVQFLKSGAAVGEIAAAPATPFLEIHPTGLGFLRSTEDPRFAEHRAAAQAGMNLAAEALAGGRFALVVLDEIFPAVECGLVDEEQVMALMAHTPPEICLVLTGRGASPAAIERADTVTEMRCLKHGYDAGIAAQKGVER